VVAWGTSAPELLVSLSAVSKGSGGIALGNVVGSNITNICVILGLTACVRPLRIEWQLIKLDVPILVGVTLLAVIFAWNGQLLRWQGAILLSLFIGYTVMHIVLARRKVTREVAAEFEAEIHVTRGNIWLDLFLILIGVALLALGSDWFVDGSVGIASTLGVSDAVIGLTVVALGTSMPELVTTISAAIRGSADIAAGNIVGSCIANLLAILGTTSLILPFESPDITHLDFLLMTATAMLLFPLFLTGLRLGRREGLLLLTIYAVYIFVRWPR